MTQPSALPPSDLLVDAAGDVPDATSACPRNQSHLAHLRDLMWIGLPLIGGHLAQFAIGLTDTMMMGWYGVSELAALGLGTTVFLVLFLFGSGFAWAVVPLVAAARDDQRIRRVTRMGLWLSVLFALVCLPLFWFAAPFLERLGQPADVAAQAQIYLRIAGPGILPALAVMVLKSYLAALERTSVVFYITLVAALANGVINYALIFGHWGAPELGLRGAALASLAVQVISLVGVVIYARASLPEHDLFARLWRPDFDAMAQVIKLGVPIGLTTLCEVGLFAASTLLMGLFGETALAAHVIALQCATATFMVHLGISNAATVRAGQAYGRTDGAHLRRGGAVAFYASLATAGLTMGAFFALPEELIGLFLYRSDPAWDQVVMLGTGLLVMAGIFQLADGMQIIALGLLRGIQDTTWPMVIAWVSYWPMGFGCAYLFGIVLGFGHLGIWAGLVMGLSMAAFLMTRRFLSLARAFP